MTPATTFAGRDIALFGLGGSGMATALALKAGGASVIACDDDPGRMEKAAGQGVETADLRAADWSRFAALILSPGVPLTHPEPHWSAKLAQAAGIEIIGDIELFCRERAKIAPDAPFVAITGTNGKSTTTALVSHILREAGRDVQMGGNIGTAILSLEPPANDRIHVIEMSSFQIDLTPSLKPTIGVLLNISPDHLDRHGTMENYAAIKERLLRNADRAIVGIDDDGSARIADRFGAQDRLTRISVEHPRSDGIYAQGSRICRSGFSFDSDQDFDIEIVDLKSVGALRGRHNAQNAAAAAALALALGLMDQAIASGMRSFGGLPHRMEEVGRRGSALFINDSKATNADSTEKALASFDRIFWILGGKPKEGGIAPLAPYFPKIEKAFLIGEASEAFGATLDGNVPVARCGTLDRAVAEAAEAASRSNARDAVVLLSPACASYDQFPNYEVRGNRFRELVRALPGVTVKEL